MSVTLSDRELAALRSLSEESRHDAMDALIFGRDAVTEAGRMLLAMKSERKQRKARKKKEDTWSDKWNDEENLKIINKLQHA